MNHKKLMRLFTITWFLMLALLLAVLYLASQHGKALHGSLVGAKGDKGEPAVVDYEYVNTLVVEGVKAEVATIPKPQDGASGTDGLNGLNGRDGQNGRDGRDGEQGPPGRELQIQVNPETRDLEIRYDGDTFWSVLIPCVDLQVGCEDGNIADQSE